MSLLKKKNYKKRLVEVIARRMEAGSKRDSEIVGKREGMKIIVRMAILTG